MDIFIDASRLRTWFPGHTNIRNLISLEGEVILYGKTIEGKLPGAIRVSTLHYFKDQYGMKHDNQDALSDERINRLIRLYREYIQHQQAQQMRGLNDFNVLSIVRTIHDEAGLHSRFLHALLDPTGAHGQQGLFIELFLKTVGLSSLEIDIRSCHVFREYEGIDIYITDGNRHIIIENKIYAADQNTQIERYVDTISKSRNKANGADITVIYLSLDGKPPSKSSLGRFNIIDGQLHSNTEHYPFLAISYGSHILEWVKQVARQIDNITNLSVALKQYEEVILELYNRRETKLMRLKEYIDSTKEDSLETLETLWKLNNEYPDLRRSVIRDFFKSVRDLLESDKRIDWPIRMDEEKMGKKYGQPFVIEPSKDSNIRFCLEFEGLDYNKPYFGIAQNEKISDDRYLSLILDSPRVNALLLDLDMSGYRRQEKWWVIWKWYDNGDTFRKILDDGGIDRAAENLKNEVVDMFQHYRDLVIACNEAHDPLGHS